MTEIESTAVQIATVFGCLFFIFVALMVTRERLAKKAATHVKVKFINYDLGRGWFKLVPINVSDGTISLQTGKKEETEKTYPIGGTYDVDYPESWPRILQVPIREMVVSTDTWVPLSEQDRDKALAPEFLTIIRNEHFTEQTSRRVHEEAVAEGHIRKPGTKINWTVVLVLILLVLVGVIGYWLIENGPKIMAGLGVE